MKNNRKRKGRIFRRSKFYQGLTNDDFAVLSWIHSTQRTSLNGLDDIYGFSLRKPMARKAFQPIHDIIYCQKHGPYPKTVAGNCPRCELQQNHPLSEISDGLIELDRVEVEE